MAVPPVSRYLTFSVLFVLSSLSTAFPSETLGAIPPFSFSFQRFEKNHSSDVALHGDAEISDSVVRITRPAASSRGRIVYRKPIRFVGTKPGFSTYFSFSISPGEGDGPGVLAFLLVPSGAPLDSTDAHQVGFPPCILSVKYVTSRTTNSSYLSGSHIEMEIGDEVSTRSSNLSGADLVLNSGEKLHSWIDYDGDSKRVEVRLSKSRAPKPSYSFMSYPIDLSTVLWRETMLVGMTSSSGNSTQASSVYSWSFALKHGAPYLMHSEPLDPRSFLVKPLDGPPIHLRRAYPWRILMALVFGAACGLLVAFAVLLLWSVMFDRRPVAPVEYPEHSIESGYEKIILVGGKGVDSTVK